MKWFNKRSPFDSIPFGQFSHRKLYNAFKKDIDQARVRLKAVAQSTEEATFVNTILELEDIETQANRYFDIYASLNAILHRPDYQSLRDPVHKQLDLYHQALLVPAIFDRIEYVYRHSDPNLLTHADEALILHYYNFFVEKGIHLTKGQKKTLLKMDRELVNLGDKYTNNLSKLQDSTVKIRNRDQLQGISPYFLSVAKKDARKNAYSGYLLRVNDNAYKEILKFCDNRTIREKVYSMHYNTEQNKYLLSNEVIGKRMLQIRQQMAKMHNHRSFSDLTLAFNSVPNYTQLSEIFRRVKINLVPRMKKLTEEVKRFAERQDQVTDFNHWDFDYYLHQMKIKKYNLHEQKLSEYFPLDHVKKETFKILKRMFGLTFKKAKVPLYHKQAEGYRVFKGQEEIGLVYMDLFDRPDKDLVPFCMSIFDGKVNNKAYALISYNFKAPIKDQPVLLSFEDVKTWFHELGHLLHLLFSKVEYPSISGFNVSKDFEEVPSLFLEALSQDPEVLLSISKHYKTKKPLSRKLLNSLNKFQRLERLVDIYSTLRYSMLDVAYHRSSKGAVGRFYNFENRELKDMVLFPRRKGDSFLCNFEHIFSNSHGAAYYSYLWSDIIKEDLWAQFKGDARQRRKTANKLVKEILSKGASVSELDQIRSFKGGRGVSLTPFLKSIKLP